MKKILVFFLILVIFVSACTEEEMQEFKDNLVKTAYHYKKAEMSGKLLCPKERPFRIGGVFYGSCVDGEILGEYIELKLKGSTSYDEKTFLINTRAQFLGQKNNCPPDKPYYVKGFFLFGGKCISQAEFEKQKNVEVIEWEEHETDKDRFVESSMCDPGFLFDTHKDLCVSTSQCNDAHMFFNRWTGDCDCDEGYIMTDEECVREITNRECEYDSDCGQPSCSGSYTKRMPRCNVRTYRCYTETVDCKEYFGSSATCRNGLCYED